MPTVSSNGIDLHYVERGAGEQTVVFSHSYLLDHRHFEPQIAALSERYRVIAYDHRDHGQSGRARSSYGIYDLVADGAAVIEHSGAAPCHWVGLSTGGYVGMRLAIERPQLFRSLTLMDTAGGAEPLGNRIKYTLLLALLRVAGTRLLVGEGMKALFGRTALADPQMAERLGVWRERVRASDPAALIRFGKAIWSRDDVLAKLRQIDLPALVIAGSEDKPTPPEANRRLADAIGGAGFELIADAGHVCTVERPEAVNQVLVPFIDRCARIAA